MLGSGLGLLVGKLLSAELETIAISALGLVTVGMSIKMFLSSKNILILAGALVLGGILGTILGVQNALNSLAEMGKYYLGGDKNFANGLVTATVLFCVGPMTIMGSIQDGLEGKSELLRLKSVLDGVASTFLAASLGVGVLFSAVAVLVIQGILTLFSKKLIKLKEDDELISELTGVGGPILLATGLSLLNIKKLPTADYLPALVLAPLMLLLQRSFSRSNRSSTNQ
jgi:uncharacterized protein